MTPNKEKALAALLTQPTQEMAAAEAGIQQQLPDGDFFGDGPADKCKQPDHRQQRELRKQHYDRKRRNAWQQPDDGHERKHRIQPHRFHEHDEQLERKHEEKFKRF